MSVSRELFLKEGMQALYSFYLLGPISCLLALVKILIFVFSKGLNTTPDKIRFIQKQLFLNVVNVAMELFVKGTLSSHHLFSPCVLRTLHEVCT